jgi:hypothetical protein
VWELKLAYLLSKHDRYLWFLLLHTFSKGITGRKGVKKSLTVL